MSEAASQLHSAESSLLVSDQIKVLIADDHELVRSGIRQALRASDDIRVVGEASDGAGALAILETHEVDVLLLDVRMPRMSGLECLREATKRHAQLSVLMLSVDDSEETITEALACGATGYITKSIRPTDLATTIRQASSGTVIMGGPRLVRAAAPAEPCVSLTGREREILAYVAKGMTNADIAGRLYLTTKTVKYHLTNLFVKLGVTNRTEAAAYALNNHLVD